MHSPVQIVAFHHSDTIRSETSQPPCSQKYAMKYALNPIYNQWHPTNSMVPQPTVRMVQGWMCWPMESGVVDFRRPFSMWECLTPLLPLTETRHRQQCTWSINLRRSWPISNGYKKWSTPLLLTLFFQPQEVWAKKPPLFISVKHSWLPRNKTPHIAWLHVGYSATWAIPSFALSYKQSEVPDPLRDMQKGHIQPLTLSLPNHIFKMVQTDYTLNII